MQNKPTKRIAAGWVVWAIGIMMLSLGSAAAADPGGGGSGEKDELSPEDRCAIVKLQATWKEAKCLADAQIRGIRQELTDEEVDKRLVACRERKDQRFEN